MPFELSDVVPVPFRFTSHTVSKKRPAVVISNRAYSIARLDGAVIAVASQLRPGPTRAAGREGQGMRSMTLPD